MKRIAWIKSPNFTKGRGGRTPDIIVIHVMEGSLRGTDSWFRNPASQVSAHYGIGLNRAIHQYVSEDDQAWHAGRVLRPTAKLIKERPSMNPNLMSIGIEHEGTAESIWPDAMYADSAELVAQIAAHWNIPLDHDHVIGHREIFAEKSCPGMGDVHRIIELAKLINAPVPRVLQRGMSGPDVLQLQVLLGVLGYLTVAQIATGPGNFGPQTEAALRKAQRDAGIVSDGIYGPQSRREFAP